MSASLDLKWNILDWLTYQFTGGYSNNNSTNEAWETEQTFYIAETYRGYDFNSVSPNSKEFGAALLPFGGELFTNNAQQYSTTSKINCNSVKPLIMRTELML